MNDLQRLYVCQDYFNMDFTEEIEKEWKIRKEPDSQTLSDMGLLHGWTNEGLLHLTFFHNLDNSWLKLL